MNEEVKKHYVKAGKAVQEGRKIAQQEAEPGVTLYDIADKIEQNIRDKGLKPAFPVNTSVNDEAAHYTPSNKAKRTLSEDDVVKVDIGAHSNGYIADSAITINPSGEHQEIIEAAEEVLESALNFIEPGITVGELGTHIQNQIPDKYSPVRNLTGHYLGQYTQHAGISIPNIANANNHIIEKGDAIAVEPFLTTGTGNVREGNQGNIYKQESNQARSRAERKVMKEIKQFNGLPFTDRWLELKARNKMAFKKLVKKNTVHSYPVLRDKDGSIVAQAEHTVLVGAGEDEENIITTRS